MDTFQEQLKDNSLTKSLSNNIKKINLFKKIKSVDKSNGYYNLNEMLDTIGILRGGGCSIQKPSQTIQQVEKNVQIPINFATNFTRFTNIIVEKSNLFNDEIYQDEILIAFQWFYHQKEYFQILCNDDSLNSINYELIEKNVEKLLNQLPVYIKLSGYLFHSLLQICNDLFRVIFSYQLKNEDRYIQENIQQQLLNNILEIEEQIKVESSNIWITGVEFELQIIKICLTHLRTNSEKGQELLISFLCQVANSVSQLSPTSELIDTIIEGGKFLLMNFYEKKIQHPLEKYEIYYFFETLKWSLINQLKQGFSTTTTINHLQNGYSKYIQQSNDWMIHFCWINLLSDIMSYRPIISKKQVLQIQNIDQATKGLVILESQFTRLAYDKSYLKFKLFPDDKLIFHNMFYELRLFEEYLLEKQEKIQLLPNYLNFTFNNQQGGQINNLDLNIQIFTKQSNLQILNALNNLLLQSKCGLVQNFQSFDKFFQKLKTNPTTSSNEMKEIKQNISEIFQQIKEQILSCLLVLYQIHLLVIREIEINKVFKQILEKQDANLSLNNKKLQQQLLIIIKDLESNYGSQFQVNIKKIIKFWIETCLIISIYKSEYIFEENQQVKQGGYQISNEFESTFQIIHKFVLQFINQSNQSKKIFQKIYESKEIKSIFQETLTQHKILDIAIQLYNPELILQLNKEFQENFSKLQQVKWKLENIQDLKGVFIGCNLLRIIFKTLKRLIQFHKSNLVHLISQQNNSRFNTEVQSDDQDFNLQKQKIMGNLIKEKKLLIQNYFDKYNDKELTEQESNDLSELQKSVNQSITKIQFKNWPIELKTSLNILFQEIQTKLQMIELNYKYKNSIKGQILELIDNFFLTNFETLSLQNINISAKEEQNNKMIPEKNHLFNCEVLISKINILSQKSQKVKKIIQQKYITINLSQSIPKAIQLEITNLESFQLQLNDTLKEIEQLNYDCGKYISDQEQIVFIKTIYQQFSTTQSFNQINANIILFNTPTLFDDLTFRDELEFQTDKTFSLFLQEMKKDLISKQEKEMFDTFGDSSYKVRESLAFNLIKIQSNVLESPIQEFCTELLKNLWIIEKHDSVRKILKNKEMIEMQKRLFSQDLINFSNSLKLEIQVRLKSIEQLETLVLIGDNQIEMKKQLEQAYDDFETYLDNITEMSQRLDISLVFLKEITKDLKKIKSSIDQVLQSVQGLEADVRKLRGKDFMELLQIRKQKVLKQMLEKELDQVHVEITTQEYDPLSGRKIETQKGNFISYLLKQEQNDFDGEINEFLWSEKERQKDVMLLRGKAGSGKSRASNNIEELLWICDQKQPIWIPIFVSLPSLLDPRHNLIDQALESENYNFDKMQIRDFKEAIYNGKLKILFLLESYDEIKTDFMSSNLYQTNRFAQDLNLQIPGQNVKIIITTREEILTSIGYQIWFYGSSIGTFKEVELLPFSQEQSQEYIKIYIKISIKRTIKRFYEYLKQLKGQAFEIHEFKQIWSNLEGIVNSIVTQKQIDDSLFSIMEAEKLLKKLQQIQFFNYIKTDQMIGLKKDLLQLWSEKKFLQVIENVNIGHLLCTPFMMEIIVYVLPKMSQQFSQATYIRDVVTKNYIILKRQSSESEQLINQFKDSKQNQKQKKEHNDNKLTSIKLNQNQINPDKVILQQFNLIMEELENQNFFESFSITNQLEYISNTCIGSFKDFHVKFDANFIVAAFKLNQLTAFDFYETFVNYYSNQQIEKQKDLGKITNHESFYIDLQDLSLYLAIDMSMRQITQVNYKQKGKLQIQNVHEDRNDQKSWDDLYFDEILDNPEYKSQLRKCMLISSKGNLHAFHHKSIQEFFVAKYILKLYQTIFNQNQEIDIKSLEKSIYNNRLFNLSQEHYFGTLELLKPKLISLGNIKSKLIQMTKLTTINSQNNVIRSSSNSIYLLSYLREHLQNIEFNQISISNTKLNELTFFKCNLNFSKFENVCIDSCNFNCSTIQNVEWKNLILTEKKILKGHNQNIISIDFTDDGLSLISVDKKGVINKWLIQSDENPNTLNLDTDVFSTSYSKISNILVCQTKSYIQFINCQKELKKMDEISTVPNYNYQEIRLQHEMQYLAASDQNNKKIYLWEIKDLQFNNQIQPIISQPITKGSIKCLAMTKDCKLIATGYYQIKIWMSKNCKEYQEIAKVYENLEKNTNSIIFSTNEEILITGGEDQKIRFWDIKNLQNIQQKLQLDTVGQVQSLSYQIDGKYLALRTNKSIKLYDAKNPILSQHFFKKEIDFTYDIFQISPNNQTLAIITILKNEEQTIMIWNIQDYTNMSLIKQFNSQKNKKDQVKQLQFSPDGQILVEITNNAVYLWDLKDYKLISKLENQLNNIQNLSFSTNQTLFAICCANKQLTLWNIQQLKTPQNIATLNLQYECCQAYFCPNEQIIISFSKNSEASGITFWDAKQFKQITTLIKDEVIRNVSFNTDGNIMISFSNSLRIWKKNQQQFEIQTEYRYNCKQISQSFVVDHQHIIVLKNKFLTKIILSNDQQINDFNFGYQYEVKNFDMATNRQFFIINGNKEKGITLFLTDQQQQTMLHQNDFNDCNDFSISQDHTIIAIVQSEGTIIKDMKTKQVISEIQNTKNSTCVMFYQQSGNKYMIIGQNVNQGQLVLYDVNNFSQIIQIKQINLLSHPCCMYFLQEQQQLIIVQKNYVTIHKMDNLEQSNIIPIKGSQSISKNLMFNKDQSAIILGVDDDICIYSLQNQIKTVGIPTMDNTKVLHLSFSKYNQTLIIIKEQIYIEWDLNLRKIIKQQVLKIGSVFSLTMNELETQLISVSKDNAYQKLRTIDLKSGKIIQEFEKLIHAKVSFITAAYTQDGNSFIIGYSNRTFHFVDSKSCKILQVFNSYTPTIDLIQISNLGIMAQVSIDKIKLWNLVALKQGQSQQEGHSDQIKRLIVSPDGLSLVSGSESEIIRWDLQENKKIDQLLNGKQLPSQFLFSFDGQFFAALEEGNWIKIWKITSLYIIEHCFRLSSSNDTLQFQFINNNQLVSKQLNKEYIMIWDLEKAYACKKLPYLNSIEFSFEESITIISPDTQLIVTSNPLQILYPKQQFQLNIDQVINIGFIAISHNSKLLAIENINKSIIIWSVPENKILHTFNFAIVKDLQILSIVFSGNNKTLLSTHEDLKFRLWSVDDGQYQLLKEVDFLQYQYIGSIQTFSVDEDNFIIIWSEYNGYDQIFESELNYKYFQGHQQQTQIGKSSDYAYKIFIVGYSNQKQMFAIQFQKQLLLYDINSKQIVATLEGNEQLIERSQKQNQELIQINYQFIQNKSTIISFSPDGSKLITKDTNQILKLWDISDINDIKYKINFKQIVKVKAAQFLMDGENIRIISKDNKIYNQNIQEFTQFCRISSKKFEFLGDQNLNSQQYQVNFTDFELDIIDLVTKENKYSIKQLSSKITSYTFTPSYQQFILGVEDGSIFLYLIDQNILKEYKEPVCYKIFAKNTQLQANFCLIGGSTIETQENEKLQKLLIEKGALE